MKKYIFNVHIEDGGHMPHTDKTNKWVQKIFDGVGLHKSTEIRRRARLDANQNVFSGNAEKVAVHNFLHKEAAEHGIEFDPDSIIKAINDGHIPL